MCIDQNIVVKEKFNIHNFD